MATPPFNISENEPSPSSFISQYPTNEQTFRDIVESWLLTLSDNMGVLNVSAFPVPFELESTDAGASVNPIFSLYRNSATPAAADFIGEIEFNGEDSAGNKTLFGQIYGQIADPTNGSEDGTLGFSIVVAGSLTSRLTLTSAGANVSGAMAATGAVSGTTGTFSGTVTAGQIFQSDSVSPIFQSGGGGGTMFFRPNPGSATGQMQLPTDGSLRVASLISSAGVSGTTGSFSGTVTSGGNFVSGGTNVVLSGNNGQVVFRPVAFNSSTGQAVIGTTGNMTVTGNFTAGGDITANSDRRLKTDIEPLGAGWVDAMFADVNAISFKRLDTETYGIGFIAQDIKKWFPELVGEDPETGMLSVAYGNVTAVLWREVQTLRERIANLEARA